MRYASSYRKVSQVKLGYDVALLWALSNSHKILVVEYIGNCLIW